MVDDPFAPPPFLHDAHIHITHGDNLTDADTEAVVRRAMHDFRYVVAWNAESVLVISRNPGLLEGLQRARNVFSDAITALDAWDDPAYTEPLRELDHAM